MNLIELRNAIDRNDQVYYNGGGRPVDDSVYDGWKRELQKLCPTDERLSRVGAPIPATAAGKKVRHRHPMGSLANVMDSSEFMKWHESMKSQWPDDSNRGMDIRYNVSFKMDGGSAALFYEKGQLVCAATRGDGEQGEDITANALRMNDVPRTVLLNEENIPAMVPFNGSVRGEVMLFNADWKLLDPDQTSNPRNLGNGMMSRSDGEDCEKLTFVAFRLYLAGRDAPLDLGHADDEAETESGMLATLRTLGFRPLQFWSQCTAERVLEIYEGVLKGTSPFEAYYRDTLPFWIDGLVVKVESIAFQEKLGVVSNRPRAQVAFKFPPLGAETAIRNVVLSVGHTGGIIPTAVFNPVKIGGVIVSRALLCNWDEIRRLDVAVNDVVYVTRQGDVIPKVVEVRKRPGNRVLILEPANCPVCLQPTGRRKGVSGDESVVLYCLNPACSAKALGKIKTWIKKLDIQGLGDVYIEQLFEARLSDGTRLLEDVSDLYRLKHPAYRAFLVKVIGEPRAVKVLAEIEKKRELSLSDFLGSLGIDGLGRRRVVIVSGKCENFRVLEAWLNGGLLKHATEAGLPGAATVIQEQIDLLEPLIEKLLLAGVSIVYPAAKPTKPMAKDSKEFCITGKLSQPKHVFHDLMASKGHRFTETYHKGIDFLVAADPGSGSSKMKKAEKDGVRVISEADLMGMLK